MWRVVVADQRSPRDGRVIETIGHYNAQTEPSTIVIDEERAREWIERGAQPTRVVRKLLRIRELAPAEDAATATAEPESGSEEPAPTAQAEPQPPADEAEQGEQPEAQASDADAGADEAGGAEG